MAVLPASFSAPYVAVSAFACFLEYHPIKGSLIDEMQYACDGFPIKYIVHKVRISILSDKLDWLTLWFWDVVRHFLLCTSIDSFRPIDRIMVGEWQTNTHSGLL